MIETVNEVCNVLKSNGFELICFNGNSQDVRDISPISVSIKRPALIRSENIESRALREACYNVGDKLRFN